MLGVQACQGIRGRGGGGSASKPLLYASVYFVGRGRYTRGGWSTVILIVDQTAVFVCTLWGGGAGSHVLRVNITSKYIFAPNK